MYKCNSAFPPSLPIKIPACAGFANVGEPICKNESFVSETSFILSLLTVPNPIVCVAPPCNLIPLPDTESNPIFILLLADDISISVASNSKLPTSIATPLPLKLACDAVMCRLLPSYLNALEPSPTWNLAVPASFDI